MARAVLTIPARQGEPGDGDASKWAAVENQPPERGFIRGVALYAAAIAGFALLVNEFWIGLLGSDDVLYWTAARGWLTHFPWLGDTHWGLRQTIVIPMAVAQFALGDVPLALVLPSLLYALGLLLATGLILQRAAGQTAAAMGLALVVTNPQFILLSSVANIDVAETFFVLLTFSLIHLAMQPVAEVRSRRRCLIVSLAGLSLGFAMISRETSAFAVVAIGLLALAGYGMLRRFYAILGACFLFVMCLDISYAWWMSGDPLYRFSISAHHDTTINRWLDQGAGVPLVHPAIDPVTMLLLNHEFGLLTWIGVPLVCWLAWRGSPRLPEKRLAVLGITLAVTWTVLAASLWNELDLIPRYFLLPAVLVSMLSGIALTALWRAGKRRLAVALGIILIGSNLFSTWIDSRNSAMFGEHVLVDLAARESAPIHTDPQSLRRAALLLLWKGLAGHVTSAPPRPGDLFFFDPTRSGVNPPQDWIVVERVGPRPWARRWLVRMLPGGLLSPMQYAKLGQGHPDVTLFRIP